MRFWLLSAVALALTGIGGTARADYTFVFTDSTGAAATSFSFDASQGPLVLKVYLAQTGTDTGLSDFGLKSGGVKLNYDGTVIGTSTGAITPNAAANSGEFQFGSKSTSGANTATASATVRDFNTTAAAVAAPTSGANANRVLLGTFSFTGLSVNSTTLVSVDPGVTNDNVLGDGTVLDGLINYNPTASVTVTAVPEPGTMVLTGLVAIGIAGGAVRRRRQVAGV